MGQFTAQIVFSCLIDVDHLDWRFMAAHDPHTGRQEATPSSIIFVSPLSFFSPFYLFLMHPFRAHHSTLALNCAYVLSIIAGTFYNASAPPTPQGGIRRIRRPKTFNTCSSRSYRTYSTGRRVTHKLYFLVPIKPKIFSCDQITPSHYLLTNHF